jgi:ATP-dependent Lon protease
LRGGISTVLIPSENERELSEIPDNIKENLDIRPVKWIDEVLEVALASTPKPLSDVKEKAVVEGEQSENNSETDKPLRPH